jgi:hypothetical protein
LLAKWTSSARYPVLERDAEAARVGAVIEDPQRLSDEKELCHGNDTNRQQRREQQHGDW